MKTNIPNLDLKLNLWFLNDLPARARRISWRGLPPVGPTCRSAWTRGSASLPSYRAQGVIKVLSVLALCLFGLLLPSRAQDPWLTNIQNPMDTNVSVGATVSLRVYASSTNPPITYQWQHAGTNLPGATSTTLVIANVTVAHAGGYTAWITNGSDNFTNSRTAILTVDPTYTQIMTGILVTDTVGAWNAGWIDYNGDGYLDLSVAPGGERTVATPLYNNEGDGTFRRITTNAIGQTAVRAYAHVWADYDNDGKVDLFVPNRSGLNDTLFHNDGNGAFTRITTGPLVNDGATDYYGVWGDYDRDGFLDLFVTTVEGANDLLYRNNGDGTFRKMTAAEVGPLVSDRADNALATWTDVNNDGRLELSRKINVPNVEVATNEIWHLDAEGKFYRMDIGEMKMGTAGDTDISWADYNNDGFVDGVASCSRGLLRLYRNLAGQGFTNIAATAFADPITNSYVWYTGDYDNDGWQDLVVYRYQVGQVPALYRNNGDGTFTRQYVGGPTCAVGGYHVPGDYDNDGFLDILVGFTANTRNLLFRHNGNSNHWLKVKLEGRASNRSGIGAKVRVQATIGGRTFWQMRETSGQGIGFDNGLLAHFGLGDATNVTTLRIEWPSGIVQEVPNVPANQFLTVVESQGYTNELRPSFTGATKDASGSQLSFTEPAAGARYLLEASSDLITWTKLIARTSIGVTTNYTDTRATNYASRFYRLQVP